MEQASWVVLAVLVELEETILALLQAAPTKTIAW